MNTLILSLPLWSQRPTRKVPTTSRGRALYTIDWFLNGQPVLRDHDNPCQTLKHGAVC